MEHFFFAIYCLTEVKKIFDDIFGDMRFSYYTEEDVSRQATRVQSSPSQNGGEDYSQFGISTLEQMTGSTQHKLRLTVKDVEEVLVRWANLLTEDEPQMENFDPESEQDLLLVQRSSRMEPILRLLPDIFAKYYKCLELIKQWWVLAHEIYPSLPFQRRPQSAEDKMSSEERRELTLESPDESSADIQSLHEEANLNTEILEAKTAVKESTTVLKGLEEELEALEQREVKFEILKDTFDKVGEEIDKKTTERKDLWGERDRLVHQFQSTELQEVEDKLRRLENEVRLLEFQHALLSQDYMIHMELRPSIIRFHGDVTMRVNEAKTNLDQRVTTLEKLTAEKNHISEQTAHKENMPESGIDNETAANNSSDADISEEDEVFEKVQKTNKVRQVSGDESDHHNAKSSSEKDHNGRGKVNITQNQAQSSNMKVSRNQRTSHDNMVEKTSNTKNNEPPSPKKTKPQILPSPVNVPNKSTTGNKTKFNDKTEHANKVGPLKNLPENTQSTKKIPTVDRKDIPSKRTNFPAKKVTSPSRQKSEKPMASGTINGQLSRESSMASPIPRQGGKTITSSAPMATGLVNRNVRTEKRGTVPIKKQTVSHKRY